MNEKLIEENRRICMQIPQCIGWSSTKKRIYVNSPVYVPGVETFVISGRFKTFSQGIFAGVPIGGICGNTYYLGTLSFFAVDNSGNYYAITDSHVVPCYDTVYFPSPLLKINPSYTTENIPIINPVPIGTVIYRSNINTTDVNLDMAVIKLDSGITPYTITYGKMLPLFFDVPNELEPVVKVGARTSLTSGIVVDQSATFKILNVYGNLIYFTGSLFQLPSEEGDSGGPVFVGNSIVSTIVAGNGQFAIGNDILNVISTLRSLGLRLYISNNKAVLYLAAIPPIITGTLLTALSFVFS